MISVKCVFNWITDKSKLAIIKAKIGIMESCVNEDLRRGEFFGDREVVRFYLAKYANIVSTSS